MSDDSNAVPPMTPVETPEEIRARVAAESLARSPDTMRQIVGTTAIQVAAIGQQLKEIRENLWSKDQLRGWMEKEICANCHRPKRTAVGRAVQFVTDARLLMLIIIILLILLGHAMQVNVAKELQQVSGTALKFEK